MGRSINSEKYKGGKRGEVSESTHSVLMVTEAARVSKEVEIQDE